MRSRNNDDVALQLQQTKRYDTQWQQGGVIKKGLTNGVLINDFSTKKRCLVTAGLRTPGGFSDCVPPPHGERKHVGRLGWEIAANLSS